MIHDNAVSLLSHSVFDENINQIRSPGQTGKFENPEFTQQVLHDVYSPALSEYNNRSALQPVQSGTGNSPAFAVRRHITDHFSYHTDRGVSSFLECGALFISDFKTPSLLE